MRVFIVNRRLLKSVCALFRGLYYKNNALIILQLLCNELFYLSQNLIFLKYVCFKGHTCFKGHALDVHPKFIMFWSTWEERFLGSQNKSIIGGIKNPCTL